MIATTQRMYLRELGYQDAEFIVELLNDPDWLTNIGDRGVQTTEDAKAYLDRTYLKMYREYGFGMWLCIRRTDGAKLGCCGIVKRPELEQGDLGFAFLPQFRGQGYAREAALVSQQLAVERFNMTSLQAILLPTNAPSRRLLEHLGFKEIGSYQFPDDPVKLLLMEWQFIPQKTKEAAN